MSRKPEATPCSIIKGIVKSLRVDEVEAFKIACDHADLVERGVQHGSFTDYVVREILQANNQIIPRLVVPEDYLDFALTELVPLVRAGGFEGVATGFEREISRLRQKDKTASEQTILNDLFYYIDEHLLSYLRSSSRGGNEVAERVFQKARLMTRFA